jgi:hypothetical protein
MKYPLFAAILLFICAVNYECVHISRSDDINIKARKEFQILLKGVESHVKNRTGTDSIKQIIFDLERITNIKSDAPVTHFGKIIPTYEDWLKWTLWYKTHKREIFWDNKSNVIKFSGGQ